MRSEAVAHCVPTRALVAFDVVDVLGGFATLEKRSQTLDGSVPIRVAQGCVPLLEGNAWGWQVRLTRPIELRKKLTGWIATGAGLDDRQRMTRAGVPMLVRAGILRNTWTKRLGRGAVDIGRTISVFTGLLVRPRAGYRLRASTSGNRRSWLYTVSESIIDDATEFTPLVLDIVPGRGADALSLDGEIATFGVLPARTSQKSCDLAEADSVARAHVAFYDGHYFGGKQRGLVARKYRDEIVRSPRRAADDLEIHTELVHGGPTHVDALADRVRIRNAVGLTARFDGYKVHVEPERADLEELARGIRVTWEAWRQASNTLFHEGALLYLTKYITPHPPGEPHFFVKPPTLIRTTAGTSTLIDGIPGVGYDIMRGVVRTDSFHAVPAVFQLWRPGATIRIPRGTPLCDLFAFPRSLDDATFTLTTGGAGGSWS